MGLVSLISSLWDASSFIPSVTHVYTHQDEVPYSAMFNLAQLNYQMDLFAKQIALQAIIHTNLTPPTFSSSLGFGSLTCHSIPISNFLQNTLYHTISHSNFIQRVPSYFEVTLNELKTLVVWDCLKISSFNDRFGLLKFVSKYIAEDIATGKVMVKRKRRFHSNFPRCDAPSEDNIHALTCPSVCFTRSSLLLQF